MPRSYKRFLWFLLTLILSLLALIIGQGFATIYLSTLPHSNVDGVVYVWTWILTVQCLNAVSNWVLERKVRSRALVFLFRVRPLLVIPAFANLSHTSSTTSCSSPSLPFVKLLKPRQRSVYQIFYRNLFARLRSPDQALYIQLLSSSWVVVWYPISMSRTFHRILKWTIGFDKEWEEYAEGVGASELPTWGRGGELMRLGSAVPAEPRGERHKYVPPFAPCRRVLTSAQWSPSSAGYISLCSHPARPDVLFQLTILHFGPNKQLYPYFSFDSEVDPYTYRLTAIASLVIWATELTSSFLARAVIWFCYKIDVTNVRSFFLSWARVLR